nr:DUF4342 domain-containing protein [Thermosinus carboxydivorans]
MKHDGRTLVDIPVTLGTIGAVVLPQLAALGVLVAVFKRCTIEVVRNDTDREATASSRTEAQDNTNTQTERIDKGLL